MFSYNPDKSGISGLIGKGSDARALEIKAPLLRPRKQPLLVFCYVFCSEEAG